MRNGKMRKIVCVCVGLGGAGEEHTERDREIER